MIETDERTTRTLESMYENSSMAVVCYAILELY
jgi:hypothetical protein